MSTFLDNSGMGVFTVPGALDAYMLSRGHILVTPSDPGWSPQRAAMLRLGLLTDTGELPADIVAPIGLPAGYAKGVAGGLAALNGAGAVINTAGTAAATVVELAAETTARTTALATTDSTAATLATTVAGKVAKGEVVINAKDSGVVGDGTTDDTAALNAAAAAALAVGTNARLLIPPGTYKITGTVTVACQLDASQATLSYSGTGTALLVGTDTSGAVVSRKTFDLPRVICASRPANLWDGSSRGVVLSNLNDCTLSVPFVQDFEQGLVVYGKGQGTAYCRIMLGSLWNNHKQLILDRDATGWSNQNTFIGGRLQQVIERGAAADDTTANQILIGMTSGAMPNQNTFIGTSIEGANPSYYKIDCDGRYNQFVNCRFEPMGGTCRVRWRANSAGNVIDHGYEAEQVVETFVAGSSTNELHSLRGAYVEAQNTSTQVIPTDPGPSFPFVTITGWTSTQYGAAYVSGNGSWTPRQGRWRISAIVSTTTTGADIRIRLLAAGGRIVAVDQKPPVTGATVLRLSGTDYFNGNESLVVQIMQATNARTLTATAGYVALHAEWIGPS